MKKDIIYILIIILLLFALIFTKSCCKEKGVFVPIPDYKDKYEAETKGFKDSLSILNEKLDSIKAKSKPLKGRINKTIAQTILKDTVFIKNDSVCISLIKLASSEINKRDSIIYLDSLQISNLEKQNSFLLLQDSVSKRIIVDCNNSTQELKKENIVLTKNNIELNKKVKSGNKVTVVAVLSNVLSFFIGKSL